MRYIKLFENFNKVDIDKLKENIEACLVELSDKRFEVYTIVGENYINIEISKKGDEENNFYQGYDSFELDEIENDIKQVCDYISEMYDNIYFVYIPETRWDNKSYHTLEEIPGGLDLVRFDLYVHTEKYFNKVITESLIDDMILSDDELKRLWYNIKGIFVDLEDKKYDISLTSYNKTTGLDVTLISPIREPLKYENIVDNTFEDFMKDYYSNDEVTFLYTYYDNNDRVNSTRKLSEEIMKKYFINKIVISVQKNNERIIQKQKDKYI